MSQVLTVPLLVAAVTLCVAAVAKLRWPATAVQALRSAGLAVPGAAVIRAGAACELVLGGYALAVGGRIAAGALSLVYGAFAVIVLRMASTRTPCGCFGEREAPASRLHASLNATLALCCLGSIAWPAHGLNWVLERPVMTAATLMIGLMGAAYGAVIAYTELPRAWNAWEP